MKKLLSFLLVMGALFSESKAANTIFFHWVSGAPRFDLYEESKKEIKKEAASFFTSLEQGWKNKQQLLYLYQLPENNKDWGKIAIISNVAKNSWEIWNRSQMKRSFFFKIKSGENATALIEARKEGKFPTLYWANSEITYEKRAYAIAGAIWEEIEIKTVDDNPAFTLAKDKGKELSKAVPITSKEAFGYTRVQLQNQSNNDSENMQKTSQLYKLAKGANYFFFSYGNQLLLLKPQEVDDENKIYLKELDKKVEAAMPSSKLHYQAYWRHIVFPFEKGGEFVSSENIKLAPLFNKMDYKLGRFNLNDERKSNENLEKATTKYFENNKILLKKKGFYNKKIDKLERGNYPMIVHHAPFLIYQEPKMIPINLLIDKISYPRSYLKKIGTPEKKLQEEDEKILKDWLITEFFPNTPLLYIAIGKKLKSDVIEKKNYQDYVKEARNFFDKAGVLVMKDTQVQLTKRKEELLRGLPGLTREQREAREKFLHHLDLFFSFPFSFQENEEEAIKQAVALKFGVKKEQVQVSSFFSGSIANTALANFTNKENKQIALLVKYKRPGLTEAALMEEARQLGLNLGYEQRYQLIKQVRKEVRMALEAESILDNHNHSYWKPLERERIYMSKLMDRSLEPQSAFLFLEQASGVSLSVIFEEIRSGKLSQERIESLEKKLNRVVETWLKDGLENRRLTYWHADLHSGNLLYDKEEDKLTIIDFGQVENMKGVLYKLGGNLERTAWLTKRKFLSLVFEAMREVEASLFQKSNGGSKVKKKKTKKKRKEKKEEDSGFSIPRGNENKEYMAYENLMHVIQCMQISKNIYQDSNKKNQFHLTKQELAKFNRLKDKKYKTYRVEKLVEKLFDSWFSKKKGDLFFEGKDSLKKLEVSLKKAISLLEQFHEAVAYYKANKKKVGGSSSSVQPSNQQQPNQEGEGEGVSNDPEVTRSQNQGDQGGHSTNTDNTTNVITDNSLGSFFSNHKELTFFIGTFIFIASGILFYFLRPKKEKEKKKKRAGKRKKKRLSKKTVPKRDKLVKEQPLTVEA